MADVGHRVTIGDLPFKPVRGQVIYVDSDKDKRINAFIVSNYDWLRDTFRKKGLDFCYLPLLGDELIAYHAPYLSGKQRQDLLQSVPSLASLIKRDDGEPLTPSLLYAIDDDDDEMRLMPINVRWFKGLNKVFTALADSVRKDLDSHYTTPHDEDVVSESDIRFSLSNESPVITHHKGSGVRFSSERRIDDDFDDFDSESVALLSKLKTLIEALRDKGVNTMIIHGIVDEGERLSSLHITKDYRIILPDYDNMEITIPDLPKAVFILFLRHPEGIRFKDLADYYDELLGIYRALNPIGGTQRQLQSIQAVTNPMSNSINEKCAQIREAFIKHFDDRLARHYYISGKRGEPKRITLPPSLVVWEQ